MPSVPFYENWTFWTAFAAVLALILSQLPPLRELLKGARLDMDVYSRIPITHRDGNPNIQVHLVLKNIGGKSIKIKSAIITLVREGKEVASLPAQNFLKNPNNPDSMIPFVSFNLRPKDDWAYLINFLNYFSRENEKKYRAAESAIKERIYQIKNLPENKEKDEVLEAEDTYIKPFIELFNELFIWQAGEYEMRIRVDTDPGKAAIHKTYRFTLFESDSNSLRKHKDYYKTGEGIFWGGDHVKGIIVQIVENIKKGEPRQ